MYGLPQVGILANELLQRNLAKDDYRPTHHTHGLWTHDTHPISFSLVVDDFGVKYVGGEHAAHLMACIQNNYNISSDWNGRAYCGLTLDLDYKNRTVDLSMPGYIKAALHKYQHAAPALPEHAQHTRGIHVYMAPKHNMWRMKQPAQHFPTKTYISYNNLRAHYYTMPGPLIQP
jgi:hypothetical protein